MNILSYRRRFALVVMAVFGALTTFSWAAQFTGFTNIGSIANTRHNMTQSSAGADSFGGGFPVANWMADWRSDYGEVCVYCHTPHGANQTIAAPLWNRTIQATTYSVYNSGSLTQTVSQPGGSSLTCLSCHDGQTAIDSIINMPGSGRYNANQQTTQNIAFLSTWDRGPGYVFAGGNAGWHMGLNSTLYPNGTYTIGTDLDHDADSGSNFKSCLSCHNPSDESKFGVPDFTVFLIGTDLTNDHPVGVTFPATTGTGTGFNTPIALGAMRYFDVNGNGALDKGDVRVYGAGAGGAAAATSATVKCASCHDPHGVPSAGPGSVFKPSFLRVDNAGSALCLTCHTK